MMASDIVMQLPTGAKMIVSMEESEPSTEVATAVEEPPVEGGCTTSTNGPIIVNVTSVAPQNGSPSECTDTVAAEQLSDTDTIDMSHNTSTPAKVPRKRGRPAKKNTKKTKTVSANDSDSEPAAGAVKPRRGRPKGSKNVKPPDKEDDEGKNKKKGEETLFSCDICQRFFTKMGQLKEHVIRRHNEERNHICMICNKKFKTRGDLNKHTLIHTGVKAFKCKICGKAFTQSNGLKSHMAMHTGVRAYTCPMCHKAFTQSSHMTRHMKMHTDTGTFDCPTCGKSFKHQANLSTHMYNHRLPRAYKCDICHQAFKRSGHLKKHEKTHKKGDQKRYPCVLCTKSFDLPSTLVSHMLKHKYNCDVCHKVFTKASRLKDHLKQQHTTEEIAKAAEAVASASLEKKSPKSEAKVAKRCEICGIKYTRLASHMATHEVHKCVVCQKGFITQEQLDEHLKTHSDYQIQEANNAKNRVLLQQQNQQQLQQMQPQQLQHHVVHHQQPHTQHIPQQHQGHVILHHQQMSSGTIEQREEHALPQPADRHISSPELVSDGRNIMNNPQMIPQNGGQMLGSGELHVMNTQHQMTNSNNQMMIPNGQMPSHGQLIAPGHAQIIPTTGHIMGTSSHFMAPPGHLIPGNFHMMGGGKQMSAGKGQLM